MTTEDSVKPRIAITGGSGFVGVHLIQLLASRREQPIVTALDSGAEQAGSEYPFLTHTRCDISVESQLSGALQAAHPSQIFHLAAISSLGEAAEQERRAFDVNVWGTRNLLRASSELSVPPKLLNVSTSQVYAGSDAALTESSPLQSASMYAATKRMAELVAELFRDKLRIITVRSFNHTGPGQSDSFVLPYLVRSVVEIEAGLAPPVLRVGNLEVERDFTDVRDVVRAYTMLMEQGVRPGTYNICSGKYYRLSDLLDLILGTTNVKVSVERDPTRYRVNDVKRIWGDHSKLTEATGWSPEIPIEKTLRDMVAYWRGRAVAQSKSAQSSR